MTSLSQLLLADRSLAQRLEHAEGSANIAFVEANRQLNPDSGVTWRDFDGTYAMFDGPDSPLTQTFGLGLFASPSHDSIATVEAFFTERGAPVFHETCPIADVSLLSLLPERGYRPVEQTSVMYQSLGESSVPAPSDDATLDARLVTSGEEQYWADTAALGWSESPGLADFMRGFGLITAHRRPCSGPVFATHYRRAATSRSWERSREADRSGTLSARVSASRTRARSGTCSARPDQRSGTNPVSASCASNAFSPRLNTQNK